MVRTTTTAGNREVMPAIRMALVDERRCCNAPTRPWPPYSSDGGGAAMELLDGGKAAMELLGAGDGAPMERSTPAAELQWSCSAQAAKLQVAGYVVAMEPLGTGGGASMERWTPATELQWSSSA
ncbi:hypothetical protein ACQJBY_032421 [Aegilops geniculata]